MFIPRAKAQKIFWLLLCCMMVVLLVFLVSKPIEKSLYPLAYSETVVTYAEQYAIDPYLVYAIMRAESQFNPQAYSNKGARGLMQIMPETGQWVADRLNLDDYAEEKLDDPALNLQIACWYLAKLMEEFNGNLNLVVAAYNAGHGRVQGWISAEKWNGQWESIENIPYEETRNYLKKVMKNYRKYQEIYQN